MVRENLIVIGQNWSACSVWVVFYWHSCLGEETTFCWIYTLQLKWKPAWGSKYKHISSSTAVYCWGLAFTQPLVCDMGRESGVRMCAVHSSLLDRAWQRCSSLGCLLALKGFKRGKAMAHFSFTQSAGGESYHVFSGAVGSDGTLWSHPSHGQRAVFTCSGPRLGPTVWLFVPLVYATGKIPFDCRVISYFK